MIDRFARALIVVAMLAGVAHATPDPVRKKTPDKFVRAAADAFAEALAADEKGDLPTALGLYEKAQAIAPHPSTAYNIGDVYRRMGKVPDAILQFETYLAMAPDAPDRKDCEAIIEKLVHTPGTIYLVTSQKSDPQAIAFKEFYILVDGEIVAKPGTDAKEQPKLRKPAIALPVEAGTHAIDLVSSISYAHADCKVIAGGTEECMMRAKPRIDGHAVFRASDNRLGVHKTKHDGFYADRVEVAPGKWPMMVRDRNFECPSIWVEVPGGANDVAYVYVGTKEWDGFERCRKLDVKQHKLHFEN